MFEEYRDRKKLPLVWHPSMEIMDATKLSENDACERKGFFSRWWGWQSDTRQLDLDFGAYVHHGMEHITPLNKRFRTDYMNIAEEAYQCGLEQFREEWEVDEDDDIAPKNPAFALEGYVDYMKQNVNDDYEVLTLPDGRPAIEIFGDALIDPKRNRLVTYKMDAVLRDTSGSITGRKGAIFCMEHKTSKADNENYRNLHKLGHQVNLYTLALRQLFPHEDVFGIVMNFLIYRKGTVGKDGIRKNGFMTLRMPVEKTVLQMTEWLWRCNHRLDLLEHELDQLERCNEHDDILFAFPLNTKSCYDFHRPCAFWEICTAIQNPLKRYDASKPPPGFKVDFWNPKEEHLKFGRKEVKR